MEESKEPEVAANKDTIRVRPVPRLTGEWKVLYEKDKANGIQDESRRLFGILRIDTSSIIKICRLKLYCYPNFYLIELLRQTNEDQEFNTTWTYFLLHRKVLENDPANASQNEDSEDQGKPEVEVTEADIMRINGTSPVIHDFNRYYSHELILEEQSQIVDYLRFFCWAIHGEEGPFYLIENIDDLNLKQQISEEERGEIVKALTSFNELVSSEAVAQVKEGEGEFVEFNLACILYADAVFRAKFRLDLGRDVRGMVEMTDDEPVRADLPIYKSTYVNGAYKALEEGEILITPSMKRRHRVLEKSEFIRDIIEKKNVNGPYRITDSIELSIK